MGRQYIKWGRLGAVCLKTGSDRADRVMLERRVTGRLRRAQRGLKKDLRGKRKFAASDSEAEEKPLRL